MPAVAEPNSASARAVVIVRRWSWSSVTLRLSFVGRMSDESRLPQYFITAMFTGAVQVASYTMVATHVPYVHTRKIYIGAAYASGMSNAVA